MKYEKYVKFVVSFMLVAQMIFSFGAYFQNEDLHFMTLSKQEYYEKWEEYLGDVERNYEKQQKEMEQGISEVYEKTSAKNESIEQNNKKENKIRDIEIEAIEIP